MWNWKYCSGHFWKIQSAVQISQDMGYMLMPKPDVSPGILAHPREHIGMQMKYNLFPYNFLSFIFISWRLITLQYCSGFCHTLT